MRIFLLIMAVYLGLFGLIIGASVLWSGPAKSAEIPEEILECITDADCEYEAEVLCEAGHLEWCVEVA